MSGIAISDTRPDLSTPSEDLDTPAFPTNPDATTIAQELADEALIQLIKATTSDADTPDTPLELNSVRDLQRWIKKHANVPDFAHVTSYRERLSILLSAIRILNKGSNTARLVELSKCKKGIKVRVTDAGHAYAAKMEVTA